MRGSDADEREFNNGASKNLRVAKDHAVFVKSWLLNAERMRSAEAEIAFHRGM